MLKFEDLEKYAEFREVISLFDGWLMRAVYANTCKISADRKGVILGNKGGKIVGLWEWFSMQQAILGCTIVESVEDRSFAGLIITVAVRDKKYQFKDESVGGWVVDGYSFKIDTRIGEIDAVSAKLGETVKLNLPEQMRDSIHKEWRKRRKEYNAACERTQREFAEAV